MAKTSAIRLRAMRPALGPSDRGGLQSIEFKPAKGGVISETRVRKTTPGRDYPDYTTETAVHASVEDAIDHLKSKLESCFTKKG